MTFIIDISKVKVRPYSNTKHILPWASFSRLWTWICIPVGLNNQLSNWLYANLVSYWHCSRPPLLPRSPRAQEETYTLQWRLLKLPALHSVIQGSHQGLCEMASLQQDALHINLWDSLQTEESPQSCSSEAIFLFLFFLSNLELILESHK